MGASLMRNLLKEIRRTVGGQMIPDCFSWAGALFIAAAARFDFDFQSINIGSFILLSVMAAVIQIILGVSLHLYRGRFRIATFEELKSLVMSGTAVGLILLVFVFVTGPFVVLPRGTLIIATPLFIFMSGSIRAARRKLQTPSLNNSNRKRALLYGAGSIAENLIPQLLSDPKTSYLPVALLDDNVEKLRQWVSNVQVVGNSNSLKEASEQYGAEVLIVCIARADSLLLRRIEDSCGRLGIEVIVFPSLEEVLSGRTGIADLRSLSIEDLVGRRPLDTNIDEIANYIHNRKVLVTGAGGSIGSELCKQIARFNPSHLYLLDRDETLLQMAEISISGNGLLDSDQIILADIRDKETVENVFKEVKPDVVFHAAALKHLPALEKFPDEAWKTNVLGTLNILAAANTAGVSTFINISTDKAADPTSVLGKSKKLAEGLTSWFGAYTSGTYISVRFGNVLGSRGSLLPTFSALIETGRPLTVTHPEATRYFMSIPEACQLVLQAGSIGKSQEVLILDMGVPVKILDIAHRLIEKSGTKTEIVFTGLRPGEKLHEELYGESENGLPSVHKLISRAVVPEISPHHLERELMA
jgi:FlaA1/EpsC-like NDP-sugar epimerase